MSDGACWEEKDKDKQESAKPLLVSWPLGLGLSWALRSPEKPGELLGINL